MTLTKIELTFAGTCKQMLMTLKNDFVLLHDSEKKSLNKISKAVIQAISLAGKSREVDEICGRVFT